MDTVIITAVIWRAMVSTADEGVGPAALVKRASAIITAHILEATDEQAALKAVGRVAVSGATAPSRRPRIDRRPGFFRQR